MAENPMRPTTSRIRMRLNRFAALLALALATPAVSAVVMLQTVEEMTASSPLVVRGRVGQQQTSWDADHRRIDTYTEIQISEVLKGTVKRALVIRQPGGVVGTIGQSVAGAAKFEPGEQVILFLQPAPDDPALYLPVGLAAGKVILSSAAPGGPRAIRRLSGLAFYDPKSRGAGPVRPLDIQDLGPADAFAQRVRKAVTTGSRR
jgi:hypothetical protein